MKEFIFDEYGSCINPNRIEGGNKNFWVEIMTAEHEGKWYCGHQYWTRGQRYEYEVYLNTNAYKTEIEAICKEAGHLFHYFQSENQNTRSRLEVPQNIFTTLKKIQADAKNRNQLSIF